MKSCQNSQSRFLSVTSFMTVLMAKWHLSLSLSLCIQSILHTLNIIYEHEFICFVHLCILNIIYTHKLVVLFLISALSCHDRSLFGLFRYLSLVACRLSVMCQHSTSSMIPENLALDLGQLLDSWRVAIYFGYRVPRLPSQML